ncbi:hypothetical protein [Streptomyces flavofungini]|uniref:hypothetical protein n=1 Tax=Streptomyces flavofungini TaxID=68200 RepID=UPI0025B24895|nr:hypothetical protein [Streptomyces flavofungini]WJV51648.1 hypothetical protein QUY26_40005 [Streptomyces flavofungini]
MDLYDPYYAAVTLATATAAAVLISAVRGNRNGDPLAGVPMLVFGVLTAGGPTFYGAILRGDHDPDVAGPVWGGLAGFGIGAVVGVVLAAALFAYWTRREQR